MIPGTGPAPRVRLVRIAYWVAGTVVLIGGVLAATVSSVRFEGPAELTFAPDAAVVSLATFGEGGSHVLLYAEGETVTFSFPLVNDAPLPLTVTEVRLSDEAFPMLEVERAAVGTGELPVRVGAGESVAVTVTARYGNCRYYHEREIQSFPAAIVEASVLGLDVTRDVDFDHALVLHSPMIVDCPDRTLGRDDDVRP